MTFGSIPRRRTAGPLLIPRNRRAALVKRPARLSFHRSTAGFSLVELLLALALLLLLVGGMVFSFSTLLNGTQLEEGAGQVESLIRYARAQAANSGRRVQFVFEEETNSTSSAGVIRVTWEPDPLGQPGYFETLTEATRQADAVNELVQVEEVRLGGTTEPDDTSSASGTSEDMLAMGLAEPFSPIMFYPDGSSDSAEIILLSRVPEEEKRISVRLDGITGVLRHEWISTEPGEIEPEQPVEQQPEHEKVAEKAK